MMVWLSAQDGMCAVKLFYEENPDKLVGEGHLRERDLFFGKGVNGGVEAIGASHHEDEATGTSCHALLQPTGELHGATLCAMLIQQYQVVARLQLFPDEFCLLCFLLFGSECLGVAQLRNHVEAERHVVREALRVVIDERLHMRVGGFAYNEKGELQGDEGLEMKDDK